jgi:mannan endo-1,4-beta-mannosidase
MKLGIYRLHGFQTAAELTDFEQTIMAPVSIVSSYRAWGRCDIQDDNDWLKSLSDAGRDVLLSWEPWQLPSQNAAPEEQPAFRLSEIQSGRYDRYIRATARILNTLPGKVYLRPMHEMNGFWYPWCGTVNANSPHEFIDTWHYLRSLFYDEGADNLEWVWSPYIRSYPATIENQLESYFPGDDAVEWVGLDGYNWGTSLQGSHWEHFEELFLEPYKKCLQISRRPFIITEISSSEAGGNKADWIMAMGQQLREQFQQVKALVWFDENKECDWRIASSAEAFRAFNMINGIFSS